MVGGRSLGAVVVAVVLGICGTCVAAAPALRKFAAPLVANPQSRSLTLDVGDPPVPAGFSSVGEALQSCEFVSTEESPFKFNFNLDLLSQNIQNAAAPNRVVYENPPGHVLVYYASPCNALNMGEVPPFQGTCSGDMAVCFCSSDFNMCESIADRGSLLWYVSTEALLPLTVVQAYSAPNCYSNASMPWTTYVIYQCDESPSAYGIGYSYNAHNDQYGLCIEDNTNNALCTQCIMWRTNFACEPFPSPHTSFLQFGPTFAATIEAGETSSVVMLVSRDQFGQSLGVGGALVNAALVTTDGRDLLKAQTTDNGDGTYGITFTAPGHLSLGDSISYNASVLLNGAPVSYFLLTVVGSPVSAAPGASHTVAIILGSLGGITAVAAGLMAFRYYRTGSCKLGSPSSGSFVARLHNGSTRAPLVPQQDQPSGSQLSTYQQQALDDDEGL